MRNKLIVSLLIICIMSTFLLTSCNTEPLLIVFLGDSIAEAIAGISPLTERDRYGYFGVLGIRNDYLYRNRAIGGHKTENLLELIQQEDKDSRMTQTLLKDADIIHISILGNDLLHNDLGELILSVVNEDYTMIENILETAADNFAQIASILKNYNDDAVIMFQSVYNPVFEYSTLVNANARAELAKLNINESEYRNIAVTIMDMLNGIILDYLEAHPNEFYFIDVYSEFEQIYQEDNERGKALIFNDDIHPSAEGHAVIADLIQAQLEELNLANKNAAIRKYREIRIEQLERMYSDSIDVKAISKQIKKAESCSEITKIYFDAIRDKTAKYY